MIQLIIAGGLCYLAAALVIINRAPPQRPAVTARDRTLKMSLVIVAYNEELSLPLLFETLQQQDRSDCDLTVHLVNDCSTDMTGKLFDRLQQEAPYPVIVHSSSGRRGKVDRLRELLPQLEADVLLFTDADCRLPAGWLQAVRRWFLTEEGILGGAVLSEGGSAFQLLDWLLISGFGEVLSWQGRAQSAFGGNLAIAGSTLKTVEYARTITGDSAEDLQLVQRVLEQSLPVNFRLQPDLLVRTTSLPRQPYLQQKLRWLEGLRYLKPFTKLGLVAFALLQLLTVASVIHLPQSTLLILSVTAGNLLLVGSFCRRVGVAVPWLSTLLYPFYWVTLLVGLVIARFSLPDDWGRR
ncbi:MAG: glycosyltransferase [Candidatus Delongbacteria bacterium]|nr:glycosyltransferase [Candidatus Delongbacteria bacterium]